MIRLREVLAVWLGGALGTVLRVALGLALPAGWVALPTLVANLLGAAALGALYAFLTTRDARGGSTRGVRLFAGTGVLGGFTTYSALAVAGVTHGGAGLLYALLTLAGGVLAGFAGARAGAALGRGGVA